MLLAHTRRRFVSERGSWAGAQLPAGAQETSSADRVGERAQKAPRPRPSPLVVLLAPIVPRPALLSLSHLSLEDMGCRAQISGLLGPAGSPLAPPHLVNPALGTIILWDPS